MKVLITGATGFVGSHTAKAIKTAGHQIRLLVRSESKAKAVLSNLGVEADEIIVGDITDKDAVKRAVEGCDAVIHAAAMVATADKYADLVWETNVGGTKNVIGSSLDAGIKRIIFVSSVSAIFDVHADVLDENSPVSTAQNPYGRSKIACENYVRELQDQGAPIVITYPTGVVGPDDPALSEPHFGIKMFVGQFTFTSSTGMQFVNVADVAKAHVAILERFTGADRFMLGGYYYSWEELLCIVQKVTGRKMWYVHIPGNLLRIMGKCADVVARIVDAEFPMTAEGMSYASQWVYADSSKAEEDLGLIFTDKEETLAQVIRWMYENDYLSAKKVGKLAH
ncbi:UDP-glucose 4-epimerase [BD1-7 clade bacterium]|uniref:UDP-glucose 4-epimerase n=1 Tax=BD1-7 clade bacterium TaxID=2029982 RepID=A0A5S9PED6_9GAMM|nr:UDP-glucose 4-epimerase [BD1-7 clade bacterium]